MKKPTIEGLHSLGSSTLMDILVEYTSRYTKLLSDRMHSDELEVIRDTIQTVQQEIARRNNKSYQLKQSQDSSVQTNNYHP
jgi:hypothetical protein